MYFRGTQLSPYHKDNLKGHETRTWQKITLYEFWERIIAKSWAVYGNLEEMKFVVNFEVENKQKLPIERTI